MCERLSRAAVLGPWPAVSATGLSVSTTKYPQRMDEALERYFRL